METATITPNLEGSSFFPTYLTPTLKAKSDSIAVRASLFCENGAHGDPETFFSTTLYAVNGIVEFADVGSLVEEYFRRHDKVADIITISIDGAASMDVLFLYCEYTQPDEFDATKSFFVATHAQRVHQDSTITIAAVDKGSAFLCKFRAAGHRVDDNVLDVVEWSESLKLDSEHSARFYVYSILRMALNMTDIDVGEVLRDVLYFSVEYGGIQKMFYVVPAQAYLTFSFRNIFNVEEFIDIVGVVTTKSEVNRDIAVCAGISKQYDRSVERSYQVETEPVPADEVPMFEQFLASHRVQMYFSGEPYEVCITDYTFEPSSADDVMPTAKFTWRFADRRPRIFETGVNGVLPTRRKIFDDTFSPEYE